MPELIWHFSETRQSHGRQKETSKTEEKTLMPVVSIFIVLQNGNKDINDFPFLSSEKHQEEHPFHSW